MTVCISALAKLFMNWSLVASTVNLCQVAQFTEVFAAGASQKYVNAACLLGDVVFFRTLVAIPFALGKCIDVAKAVLNFWMVHQDDITLLLIQLARENVVDANVGALVYQKMTPTAD